jgi:hypothetical protein
MRYPDCRDPKHGPEMERKPGMARVVTASGVDKKDVGQCRESPHGSLEQWPFAEGEQSRFVASGRNAFDRGFGDEGATADDRRSCPGSVAGLSRPRGAAFKADEAPTDRQRLLPRLPRHGFHHGKPLLHLDQLVARRGPGRELGHEDSVARRSADCLATPMVYSLSHGT